MGQIYDLMLSQDKAPTMANGRRPVPPSKSFQRKKLQQSNWILSTSTKLLTAIWINGVTSQTTIVRRRARAQREEILF